MNIAVYISHITIWKKSQLPFHANFKEHCSAHLKWQNVIIL